MGEGSSAEMPEKLKQAILAVAALGSMPLLFGLVGGLSAGPALAAVSFAVLSYVLAYGIYRRVRIAYIAAIAIWLVLWAVMGLWGLSTGRLKVGLILSLPGMITFVAVVRAYRLNAKLWAPPPKPIGQRLTTSCSSCKYNRIRPDEIVGWHGDRPLCRRCAQPSTPPVAIDRALAAKHAGAVLAGVARVAELQPVYDRLYEGDTFVEYEKAGARLGQAKADLYESVVAVEAVLRALAPTEPVAARALTELTRVLEQSTELGDLEPPLRPLYQAWRAPPSQPLDLASLLAGR